MRMPENYADEVIISVDLPKLWTPMWSSPEKRNLEVMEQGREGMRKNRLPFIESAVGKQEYLFSDFNLAYVPYMAIEWCSKWMILICRFFRLLVLTLTVCVSETSILRSVQRRVYRTRWALLDWLKS